MSENSLTVESLRKHLPFLSKVILNGREKQKPYLKGVEHMKMVIECGKK
jgi:hypothetical protein